MTQNYNIIDYENLLETFFLISGTCVIEDEEVTFKVAKKVDHIRKKHDIPIFFKASFDKANRSSINSFRGPGLENGLEILSAVKERFELPICTDVHEPYQVERVAEVADIIQIPAFLCRQTDLVIAAAKTGKIVNVKKGQFLAPWDVINIMEKIKESGNHRFFITERGTSFGYNRLVVDFTGMLFLMRNNIPLIFDVTHSMQTPGSGGTSTGGNRQYVEQISFAGAALGEGLKGMFFEIHPEPDKALSDAGNSYYSDKFEMLVERVIKVRNVVKSFEMQT